MNRGFSRMIAAVGWMVAGVLLLAPEALANGDIQEVLDDLQGLTFDEFVDASYKQHLAALAVQLTVADP